MVRAVLYEVHGNINSNLETEMPRGLATKLRGPGDFGESLGGLKLAEAYQKATKSCPNFPKQGN